MAQVSQCSQEMNFDWQPLVFSGLSQWSLREQTLGPSFRNVIQWFSKREGRGKRKTCLHCLALLERPSLAAFKIIFESLSLMSLGIGLFAFFLHRTHKYIWICRFIYLSLNLRCRWPPFTQGIHPSAPFSPLEFSFCVFSTLRFSVLMDFMLHFSSSFLLLEWTYFVDFSLGLLFLLSNPSLLEHSADISILVMLILKSTLSTWLGVYLIILYQ